MQDHGGLKVIRIGIGEIYTGRGTAERNDPGVALLAASIARHGLLQPVIVRENQQAGRYTLICGARRIRACRMAGITSVDAVVLTVGAQEAAACYLEEHLTRRQPGAICEALLLRRAGEIGVSDQCVLPESEIAGRLELLGLPEAVRSEMDKAGLLFEQARPVLGVCDELRQLEAVSIISGRALTGAQAQRLVFGPSREKLRSRKRRAASYVVEAVNRAVEEIRARGIHVQVNMHTQEGGISIQITMKNEAVTLEKAGNTL